MDRLIGQLRSGQGWGKRVWTEETAALAFQSAWRRLKARKALSGAQKQDRLVMMMLAIEDERATWVQRAWREKIQLRRLEREEQAALCLQTVFRGHKIRAGQFPEMQFDYVRSCIAARRIQKWARRRIEGAMMQEECRGVLEKRKRRWKLPLGMEFVVWSERFVYTTKYELCYQKFARGLEADSASTKRLRYADIVSIIGELDTCVLVLLCKQARHRGAVRRLRRIRFMLPTPEETEVWAANLLRLVTLAGFSCKGSLELPGTAADAAHDEWMNELAVTLEESMGREDGGGTREPTLRISRRETNDLSNSWGDEGDTPGRRSRSGESTPAATPGKRDGRGQFGAQVRPSLKRG